MVAPNGIVRPMLPARPISPPGPHSFSPTGPSIPWCSTQSATIQKLARPSVCALNARRRREPSPSGTCGVTQLVPQPERLRQVARDDDVDVGLDGRSCSSRRRARRRARSRARRACRGPRSARTSAARPRRSRFARLGERFARRLRRSAPTSSWRGTTERGVTGPSTSLTSRSSVRPPAVQPNPSIDATPTGSSSVAPVKQADRLDAVREHEARRRVSARKSFAIPKTSRRGSTRPGGQVDPHCAEDALQLDLVPPLEQLGGVEDGQRQPVVERDRVAAAGEVRARRRALGRMRDGGEREPPVGRRAALERALVELRERRGRAAERADDPLLVEAGPAARYGEELHRRNAIRRLSFRPGPYPRPRCRSPERSGGASGAMPARCSSAASRRRCATAATLPRSCSRPTWTMPSSTCWSVLTAPGELNVVNVFAGIPDAGHNTQLGPDRRRNGFGRADAGPSRGGPRRARPRGPDAREPRLPRVPAAREQAPAVARGHGRRARGRLPRGVAGVRAGGARHPPPRPRARTRVRAGVRARPGSPSSSTPISPTPSSTAGRTGSRARSATRTWTSTPTGASARRASRAWSRWTTGRPRRSWRRCAPTRRSSRASTAARSGCSATPRFTGSRSSGRADPRSERPVPADRLRRVRVRDRRSRRRACASGTRCSCSPRIAATRRPTPTSGGSCRTSAPSAGRR